MKTAQSQVDDAATLVKEGNLTSAYFALKKVLRREPDHVRALIIQADIHMRSGRQLGSVEIIERLF